MENNNSESGFRILLRVVRQEELIRRCYIYIDSKKMKTIRDVEAHIKNLLGYKNFSLYIREAWLPKDESALVITSKDILVAYMNDDGQGKPRQQVPLAAKVTNTNVTTDNLTANRNSAVDLLNSKEKITSNPTTTSSQVKKALMNTVNNKTKPMLDSIVDSDFGEDNLDNLDIGTKKGQHFDIPRSLIEQLDMKRTQLLKQKNESPKKGIDSIHKSILSFLNDKPDKGPLDKLSSILPRSEFPSNNNSPPIKKKRLRRHKKKNNTQKSTPGTENTTCVISPVNNMKSLGLGKHLRFCNDHEDCSLECAANKNEETNKKKEKAVDDSETLNKTIVIVSENEGNINEITPLVASAEVSKQNPDLQNTTKVNPLVYQSKEEIGTPEKVDTSMESDTLNFSHLVDEVSKTADENEGIVDATMEDGTQVTVEETTNIENKLTITADKNGDIVDATTEDVQLNQGCENIAADSTMEEDTRITVEAVNESVGNELATDTTMDGQFQDERVVNDEFYKGDENHDDDDWKTRLLNLASEKEIRSKIFNRKCAATVL